MRTGQPIRQVPRGFVGCPPVKRHQGRRQSRDSHDVGPPAVLRHQRGLDEIRVSRDALFKAVNEVSHEYRRAKCCVVMVRAKHSYAIGHCDQAKRTTKARAQSQVTAICSGSLAGKIVIVALSTGFSLKVHRFSTQGGYRVQIEVLLRRKLDGVGTAHYPSNS
jgi:hypothetical protein